MRKSTLLCAASLAAALASPAVAQDLTIGVSAEASALDPHYHNLGPNNQMRRHMFESLLLTDENQRISAGLAVSWAPLDDTTWEFKLRQGVKFHDGSPFTARDVVYTVCRIPTVENSPSSFSIYTKQIEGMEIVDEHTLRVSSATPYPAMPTDFAAWFVIQAPDDAQDMTFEKDGCAYEGQWPKTEDFNSGELAIGTGPYKLESFTKGAETVLVRNEDYWGEDLLGDEGILESGYQATATIGDGSDQCLYDFKFVMDNGAELIEPEIDICELASYTIND